MDHRHLWNSYRCGNWSRSYRRFWNPARNGSNRLQSFTSCTGRYCYRAAFSFECAHQIGSTLVSSQGACFGSRIGNPCHVSRYFRGHVTHPLSYGWKRNKRYALYLRNRFYGCRTAIFTIGQRESTHSPLSPRPRGALSCSRRTERYVTQSGILFVVVYLFYRIGRIQQCYYMDRKYTDTKRIFGYTSRHYRRAHDCRRNYRCHYHACTFR